VGPEIGIAAFGGWLLIDASGHKSHGASEETKSDKNIYMYADNAPTEKMT
jgi:hypothetical protein